MFSVHAMVGGGQSTAARSAQVEVILELSRDVFFRSRMFSSQEPAHPRSEGSELMAAASGARRVVALDSNIPSRPDFRKGFGRSQVRRRLTYSSWRALHAALGCTGTAPQRGIIINDCSR